MKMKQPKVTSDYGETTLKALAGKIYRAKGNSRKDELFLSVYGVDRNLLLQEIILRVSPGAYPLDALRDIVAQDYGVHASINVSKPILFGLSTKNPRVVTSFTLGLQEVIIKESAQGRMSVREDFRRCCLAERYGGAAKERGIWYHGTAYKNLKSIRSKGLIPDPEERAWSSDPHSGLHVPSRVSYGGIYVTSRLMTAISSAKNYPKVIVCMELQPRTFVADEDDFARIINQSGMPSHIATHDYSIADLFLSVALDPADMDSYSREFNTKRNSEYFNDFKASVVSQLKEPEAISPGLEKALEKPLRDAWVASIYRKAAYIQLRDLQHAASRSVPDYNDNYEEWSKKIEKMQPSTSEAESMFRKAVDKVTKTLKSEARPIKKRETFMPVARVLEPIKFSGSNRIIAIIVIHDAYQPDKGRYGTELEVVYGKPPDEFLRDYKQSQGEIRFREKK